MKHYLVFGRKGYHAPLEFATKIEDEQNEDTKKVVLKSTGEEDWIELVAIPEKAVEHVVREGKIV